MTRQQTIQSNNPVEQKEWQEFFAAREKFFKDNPGLGPHGSVPNLGRDFHYHANFNKRMGELVSLVKENEGKTGIDLHEHKDGTTILVAKNSEFHQLTNTAGIRIALATMGGSVSNFFHSTLPLVNRNPDALSYFKATVKDPSALAEAFIVDQDLIGTKNPDLEYLSLYGALGPALTLIRPDAFGDALENSLFAWSNLQNCLEARPKFLEQEIAVGAKETSLILRGYFPPEWNHSDSGVQLKIGGDIRSLFREDVNPEKLTILIIEPDSPLARFHNSAKAIREPLDDLNFDPNITEITWTCPVTSKDAEITKGATAVVKIRGTEPFDSKRDNLLGLGWRPNSYQSVTIELEQQYLEDRTGKIDSETFTKK